MLVGLRQGSSIRTLGSLARGPCLPPAIGTAWNRWQLARPAARPRRRLPGTLLAPNGRVRACASVPGSHKPAAGTTEVKASSQIKQSKQARALIPKGRAYSFHCQSLPGDRPVAHDPGRRAPGVGRKQAAEGNLHDSSAAHIILSALTPCCVYCVQPFRPAHHAFAASAFCAPKPTTVAYACPHPCATVPTAQLQSATACSAPSCTSTSAFTSSCPHRRASLPTVRLQPTTSCFSGGPVPVNAPSKPPTRSSG